MDRCAPECSGLPSPHPSNFGDPTSEGHPADHASAAAPNNHHQNHHHHNASIIKEEIVIHPATVTPAPEHAVYPPVARHHHSPEQVQRPYHPASSAHSADPSIAAPSPTYPYGQHPAYAPSPDMAHGYPHPSGGMYAQPRPDWAGYQHGGPHLAPGHHVYAPSPASAPQQRPNQVYSFVPIPGAQQHKRPRRRYEEIERMYKCGFSGCEKAYGTLNHLNAHVTMQSHGCKRVPEEFKEVRKQWKARKKEEEAQRKAEEERQRAEAAAQNRCAENQGHEITPTSTYPGPRTVQLPPIGYQPTQYPAPPSANVGQQPMPEYAGGHIYPNYQPHSPYGQTTQTVYTQSNGGQPASH